jgi:hypothetical protein
MNHLIGLVEMVEGLDESPDRPSDLLGRHAPLVEELADLVLVVLDVGGGLVDLPGQIIDGVRALLGALAHERPDEAEDGTEELEPRLGVLLPAPEEALQLGHSTV